MALEPLILDDLTWDDLVQAARSRIPAASRGAWTLHAPVDPGITLLELFAAQLEERLFWLDQPCDAVAVGAKRLHLRCRKEFRLPAGERTAVRRERA